MDRPTVNKLHAELDVALAELGKKYGMKLKSGTMYFGADGVKVTVTGAEVSSAELTDRRLDGLKPDWIRNAKQMGVFLKDITYHGKKYTLTAFNGYCFFAWDATYNRGTGANLKFRQDSTPEIRRLALGAGGSPVVAQTATLTKALLPDYIAEYNRTATIFGKPTIRALLPGALTAAEKQILADKLGGELSPENLSCDGEASTDYVRQRGAYLRTVAAELEALGGVKVTY